MPEYSVSIYNDSDILKKANISFIGNALDIEAPKMYLTGFVINAIVPVYIPRIVEKFDSSAFVGGTTNVTTDSIYSNKKWNTDLSICVSYNGSYSNQCVKFEPVSNFAKEPPNTNISRTDVLYNSFFYHYTTLGLCRMIQAAINQAMLDVGLSLEKCRVIKSDDKFQFLIPDTTDLPYFSLYFNYGMTHLFYMDTISDNYANEFNKYSKLVFDEEVTTDLGITYYVVAVVSNTTTIFPFNALNFSSTNLEIDAVTSVIQGVPLPPTEKLIYSYNMNVTDPDTIARNVNFSSATYFKGKSLYGTVNKISINVSWVTPDGIDIPIYLDKYQSVRLFLEFTN